MRIKEGEEERGRETKISQKLRIFLKKRLALLELTTFGRYSWNPWQRRTGPNCLKMKRKK